MYIKLCDRCGRATKNKAAILIPVSKENGNYQCDGTWFGKSLTFCNFCKEEFSEFLENCDHYNLELLEDYT